MSEKHEPIIIIGAGPAGLAVAGRLKHAGFNSLILEQTDQAGSSWVNHYDRLHLHTIKEYSHLPHLPLPENWPQYISKNQLIEHLQAYVEKFDLSVEFNQNVKRVTHADGRWSISTEQEENYSADKVVVCTGYNRVPVQPTWLGQDVFTGSLIHSRAYRNA
ncbi:MAG: NAD(P)/FAD-dependent oxidoreductase, partial [Bacteroidota bacterium]